MESVKRLSLCWLPAAMIIASMLHSQTGFRDKMVSRALLLLDSRNENDGKVAVSLMNSKFDE